MHALWEIALSLVAAGFLLYMVIWMRRRGASLSQELREAAQTRIEWVLFSLSFFAVVREGLETALFLRALWYVQEGLSWAGGLIGLLAAAGLGALLFVYSRRVPLRPFFQVTSLLLLLIAAGMTSYAVHEALELGAGRWEWAHELEEAKAWVLFPPQEALPSSQSWLYVEYEGKYYPPLHHKGWIGGVLHALTGWRATMSWIEVAAWLGTFIGGFLLWRYPHLSLSAFKKKT
jgi:high-affinity iron transporter